MLLHSGDAEAGRRLFGETLVFVTDQAGPPRYEVILSCLEGLAAAAASLHESARAVRLGAAAAHLRDVLARPLIESERGLAEVWLEPLDKQVAADTLVEWRRQGEALSLEQAIAYALAADEPDRSNAVDSSRRASMSRSRARG